MLRRSVYLNRLSLNHYLSGYKKLVIRSIVEDVPEVVFGGSMSLLYSCLIDRPVSDIDIIIRDAEEYWEVFTRIQNALLKLLVRVNPNNPSSVITSEYSEESMELINGDAINNLMPGFVVEKDLTPEERLAFQQYNSTVHSVLDIEPNPLEVAIKQLSKRHADIKEAIKKDLPIAQRQFIIEKKAFGEEIKIDIFVVPNMGDNSYSDYSMAIAPNWSDTDSAAIIIKIANPAEAIRAKLRYTATIREGEGFRKHMQDLQDIEEMFNDFFDN